MPVFFFLFWIILNGRVTVELVGFGILISAAVTVFSVKVMGYSLANEARFWRNFPLFLLYVLNLLVEILKAALAVMGLVLSGKKPDPVIVEFHSGFDTMLQNVLLANSITLTPGTITVFLEGDHFVIHSLRKEYAQGIEDSSFVRLLKKIR